MAADRSSARRYQRHDLGVHRALEVNNRRKELNMTIDSPSSEPGSTATSTAGGGSRAASAPGEGSATRRRILQIALSLMSQRGVDGTSMRDLASAAGLNVASLYHYFPSKRELLEAVLVERGYLPEWTTGPKPDGGPEAESALAAVLTDILVSMFDVEDFVRLMAGEAMRGEETARAVGV